MAIERALNEAQLTFGMPWGCSISVGTCSDQFYRSNRCYRFYQRAWAIRLFAGRTRHCKKALHTAQAAHTRHKPHGGPCTGCTPCNRCAHVGIHAWLHISEHPADDIKIPFLALLVSGGHTMIVVCKGVGTYTNVNIRSGKTKIHVLIMIRGLHSIRRNARCRTWRVH